MRKRTNMSGLVSHNTPDGRSYLSEETKLRKKFVNGSITHEELRAYCMFTSSKKKEELSDNTLVKVKVFGKIVTVPYAVAKSAGYSITL